MVYSIIAAYTVEDCINDARYMTGSGYVYTCKYSVRDM